MKHDSVEQRGSEGRDGSDNALGLCRVDDKTLACPEPPDVTLPRFARLPINRCNLPASILGSLTFHRHPSPLAIDGVDALHKPLFNMLDDMDESVVRARGFMGYMAQHFRLAQPEDAGLTRVSSRARAKANYLRMVRGWLFDPDGREAAVLKGWAESRFGLTPRFHGEPLRDPTSTAYARYIEARSSGLYGTNALEEQVDLLYTYCQYELRRQFGTRMHLPLFRGVNRLDGHERLEGMEGKRQVVLLNNLNSFSSSRERAGEFGDYILAADVPLPKIFFFNRLLPGTLKGEDEYVAIGGLYEVEFNTF